MPARKAAGFTFDIATGRYRHGRTGRFLSPREIQRAVDVVVGKSARRIEQLAGELRAGRLTTAQWEVEMRVEVKNTQLISAMAAKGGRAQMGPADWGRVGQRVRTEYAYLRRFADQVEAGEVPLDGRFTRRSEMYAKAARGTFHAVTRDEQEAHGFTLEENVLHPGDHCEQCVEQTALGPVPIGTLVAIGERTCLSNCRCTIRYL